MNTSTTIHHTHLDNCIMNASGALCTTEQHLHQLALSNSGAIISKSCTTNPRDGNPLPRYHYSDMSFTSINSMGIPNLGSDFYIKYKNTKKPYIISIAETKPHEFDNIINDIKNNNDNDNNSVLIECNLSCPNVINHGQACSIIAYDFLLLEQKLQELNELCHDTNITLGVKLPPYFDPHHFDIVSQLIIKYNINFITTINSLPNGLIVDPITETTCIKPKNGIGGIGGDPCKPIALSNVYQFYTRLPPNIHIIGCGGIRNGTDVFEFILCGASAVQIGTAFIEEGTDIFQRITHELQQIMNEKNYKQISDFHGNIKSP